MPIDVAVEEVEALIDRAPERAAQQALDEALTRLRQAQRAAEQAEIAAAGVRQEAADLVGVAAGGETVTLKRVHTLHEAVTAHDRYAMFCGAVSRALQQPVQEAEEALAEARHAIWAPVLRRAQDLFIASGQKRDRADMMGDGSAPLLEASRRDFQRAEELLRHACRGGFRYPNNPLYAALQWPITEKHARVYWNRPVTAEEIADAAA